MTSPRKYLDPLAKKVGDKTSHLSKKVGEKTTGLARKHKLLIHGTLLLAIAVSLWTDGAKTADWLFVALSVVVEVS